MDTSIDYIRFEIPKGNVSVDLITQKVYETLITLLEIDVELFENWYEQRASKKSALKAKVDINKPSLKKIIEQEWDRDIELGSSFAFWTGREIDLENAQIRFNIGVTAKNESLFNKILISFPKAKHFARAKNNSRVLKIVNQLKNLWNTKEVIIN